MAEKGAIEFAFTEWNATLCELYTVDYRLTSAANYKVSYNSTVGNITLDIYVIPWGEQKLVIEGEITAEESLS